jgi:hypothetical protein
MQAMKSLGAGKHRAERAALAVAVAVIGLAPGAAKAICPQPDFRFGRVPLIVTEALLEGQGGVLDDALGWPVTEKEAQRYRDTISGALKDGGLRACALRFLDWKTQPESAREKASARLIAMVRREPEPGDPHRIIKMHFQLIIIGSRDSNGVRDGDKVFQMDHLAREIYTKKQRRDRHLFTGRLDRFVDARFDEEFADALMQYIRHNLPLRRLAKAEDFRVHVNGDSLLSIPGIEDLDLEAEKGSRLRVSWDAGSQPATTWVMTRLRDEGRGGEGWSGKLQGEISRFTFGGTDIDKERWRERLPRIHEQFGRSGAVYVEVYRWRYEPEGRRADSARSKG